MLDTTLSHKAERISRRGPKCAASKENESLRKSTQKAPINTLTSWTNKPPLRASRLHTKSHSQSDTDPVENTAVPELPWVFRKTGDEFNPFCIPAPSYRLPRIFQYPAPGAMDQTQVSSQKAGIPFPFGMPGHPVYRTQDQPPMHIPVPVFSHAPGIGQISVHPGPGARNIWTANGNEGSISLGSSANRAQHHK